MTNSKEIILNKKLTLKLNGVYHKILQKTFTVIKFAFGSKKTTIRKKVY